MFHSRSSSQNPVRGLRHHSLGGGSLGSPEKRYHAFVRGAAASDVQAGARESVSDLLGFGDDRLWRVIDHYDPLAVRHEDLSRVSRIGVDEKTVK